MGPGTGEPPQLRQPLAPSRPKASRGGAAVSDAWVYHRLSRLWWFRFGEGTLQAAPDSVGVPADPDGGPSANICLHSLDLVDARPKNREEAHPPLVV